MAMPMKKSIEIYLLREIEMRGGSVRARDPAIYDAAAGHFPLLNQGDRSLINVATRENKWKNRVDWVRQDLVGKGELDGSQRGIWRISQKGRDRLSREWPPVQPPEYSRSLYTDRPSYKKVTKGPPAVRTPQVEYDRSQPLQAEATVQQAQAAQRLVSGEPPVTSAFAAGRPVREELLSKLNSMNDRQFEEFVGRLLTELGYIDVDVVGRSGDGGVDVTCVLKGALVEPPLTVVCQVKRHATNIGPGAVGDLRGRWAHRADRLILINTAGFTQGAREAAREPGAKEISLVTGEDIADLMIQKGIGVSREPVVVERLDEAFFSEFS